MDPITTIAVAVIALSSPQAGSRPDWATALFEGMVRRSAEAGRGAVARYEEPARQVSNWRLEAADDLAPRPLAAFAALIQADRPVVTRCVKLNNYWCVKSARWTGEIGTDDEGHVGFASAEEGADAAATLLRRYYLEFGRTSASDIVRRWAPPDCGTAVAGGPVTMIGVLAVRGIGGTLRARYLASRRKVVKLTAEGPKGARKSGAGRPRVSVVIPRAFPTIRVPDIAAGVGGPPAPSLSASPPERSPPRRQAAATPKAPPPARTPVAATGSVPPAPAACTPDEERIRNYAARIAASVGSGPGDDLRLFAPDGTPTGNLAPVMLAMSGVELGVLHASEPLVAAAVERQAERARALRAQDEGGR